ncbi:MAG: hypothetical protein KC468_36940, partial [Myxococcales bacterium]|nr:hypothetical protein [Myxococcales bacterium]
WMLQVLLDDHGLSQGELADKLDRSTRWVSRRLGLVRALPESVQRVARKGRLPVQAATKYLVPLARANAEQQLVRGLGCGRVSVRQVKATVRGVAARRRAAASGGSTAKTWRAQSATRDRGPPRRGPARHREARAAGRYKASPPALAVVFDHGR